MSYRFASRADRPLTSRVARLNVQRQQKLARVMGALVGLSLLVGGLTVALQAHAGTSSHHSAKTAAASASSSAASRGTVKSVQAVEVKGQGSGVGVVGGAVLGGLAGNQVGRGTGNTLMTIGGAVAGGYAGNEVEKQVKKHTVYKTTVKLDNGSVHTYTVGHQFAVGARVHVSGQKLTLAE